VAADRSGSASLLSAVEGTDRVRRTCEADRPAPWSVPPRVSRFVGRGEELATLRSRWSCPAERRAPPDTTGLPQVLHGLPGVGKTQLAVEYAYRHRDDYDVVWWIPAGQPAGLLAALVVLAEAMGVAVPGEAEASARAAVAVLGAGTRYPRWLVILDNADEPADSHGLLSAAARAPHGHLLVTARDVAWARVALPLEVGEFSRDQATSLLLASAPRLTDVEAGRIAEALGFLPLALEQAGSWLVETAMPADVYLEHLRLRAADVMRRSASPGNASVSAAFTQTLQTLRDPAAAMLALLWAQFGPEPIPIGLVHSGVAAALPAPLDGAAADPFALGELVRALTRAALVRAVGDDRVVMHRLAQAVLVDATPPPLRAQLRESAHRLLAAANPSGWPSPAAWPTYTLLHPHAIATDLVNSEVEASRDLVLWLAWSMRAAGDHTNSRLLAERAYRRWAATLGESHLHTLLAAANLAATLWALAQPAEAEQMLSLERMRLAAPPPWLHRAGRITPAPDGRVPTDLGGEDLLSRVRRVYGENHPYLITVSAQVAAISLTHGDFTAAAHYFEDVCARAAENLGTEHPHTIRASAYLGAALLGQAKHDAAQRLLAATLDRAGRVLGADHPDTVLAATNLVTVLRARRASGAKGLCADVLARARRVHGDDHPRTRALRAILTDLGGGPAAA
jgi:hypothetical protein